MAVSTHLRSKRSAPADSSSSRSSFVHRPRIKRWLRLNDCEDDCVKNFLFTEQPWLVCGPKEVRYMTSFIFPSSIMSNSFDLTHAIGCFLSSWIFSECITTSPGLPLLAPVLFQGFFLSPRLRSLNFSNLVREIPNVSGKCRHMVDTPLDSTRQKRPNHLWGKT